MRLMNKREELEDLAVQLKQLSEQLEGMTHLFTEQIIEDANFAGEMVDAYQQYLQELMKEHQKMIDFYLGLSKEIKEMAKDYEDYETLLLERIKNL